MEFKIQGRIYPATVATHFTSDRFISTAAACNEHCVCWTKRTPAIRRKILSNGENTTNISWSILKFEAWTEDCGKIEEWRALHCITLTALMGKILIDERCEKAGKKIHTHVWNTCVAAANEILSFHLWPPSLVRTNWYLGIVVYYFLTSFISFIFMLRNLVANPIPS